MSPDDPEYRAAEALRIMDDPLLKAAFAELRENVVTALTEMPQWGEHRAEQRAALCMELKVLQDIQEHLRAIIRSGSKANGRGRGTSPV